MRAALASTLLAIVILIAARMAAGAEALSWYACYTDSIEIHVANKAMGVNLTKWAPAAGRAYAKQHGLSDGPYLLLPMILKGRLGSVAIGAGDSLIVETDDGALHANVDAQWEDGMQFANPGGRTQTLAVFRLASLKSVVGIRMIIAGRTFTLHQEAPLR